MEFGHHLVPGHSKHRSSALLHKRIRLFAKNYVIDIIAADDEQKSYYYTVHNRATGEVITLGQETTFDAAQMAAIRTFKELTGEELVFEKADGNAPAAS